MARREFCFISAHDARTGKEVWKFYTTAAAGEPGGDTWANMPTEQRAASPWGLPGSYDPKRQITYWGIANPDPYTRLTPSRQPRRDLALGAVESLQQLDGRARHRDRQAQWHYQELPGDDWDADHNQERILLRTIVNPDARHVKWRATDLPRNQEREVVVTVGEGGGLFMVEREGGKFLWAHPFPYDNPDLNMNEINPETGQTHVNVDKLFKKDGQTILGCFHNTRGLWSIAYHPKKNALYVPFQDQCLSMTSNMKAKTGWGPRVGVMRPGIDPNKFMNLAKIDLATGEMKVLYSQAQPSQSSALVTDGDLVFWGDANRRFRAFDADSGKVLWETVVGGIVMTSTITYAVNGKQYVAILTGDGQSVTQARCRSPRSRCRRRCVATTRWWCSRCRNGSNSCVI